MGERAVALLERLGSLDRPELPLSASLRAAKKHDSGKSFVCRADFCAVS